MVPGADRRARFGFCAGVGIEGIELRPDVVPAAAEEVRRAARETGVQPVLCGARPGGAALDARPEERARYMAAVREALDLAADVGARGVIVLATSELKEEPARPRLADLSPWMGRHALERELLHAQLRELGPHAARRGVRVIIEPVNRYEQWGPTTVGAAADICRAAGEGIGVMADFFHMQIEEADVGAAITAAGPLLCPVHVADNTRGLPGTGHMDFRPGLRALRQIAYDGCYGFEGWLPDRNPAAALRQAMEQLRVLMAEVSGE